jgi:uncharacterized membrane protein YqjE
MLFDLWSLEYQPRQVIRRLFIMGGLLILTAMAILAFPQILVAFVATLLTLGGLSLLALGWKLRKVNQTTCHYEVRYYF